MYHKLLICIKYCRAPLFYLVKRLNNIACRIFNSEGKMKLIFAIGDLQYTVLHLVLGLALRGDINTGQGLRSFEGKIQVRNQKEIAMLFLSYI